MPAFILRQSALRGGDTLRGGVATDTTPPVVEVVSVSRSKISRVNTKDSADVIFYATEDWVEYQIRVVPGNSATISSGTLLETATFAGTANSNYQVTITDDEFVAAGGLEGSNILKVFVRDSAGNWSV